MSKLIDYSIIFVDKSMNILENLICQLNLNFSL